jgi:hypothetical protein
MRSSSMDCADHGARSVMIVDTHATAPPQQLD